MDGKLVACLARHAKMDGKLMACLARVSSADSRIIVDQMLKPMLYELASIFPRWFPSEWIECPPALPEQRVFSLNGLFLRCCRLANDPIVYGVDVLVCHFVTCMDDLCCWLMIRHRCSRVYRLSFQVDYVRGVDVASAYLLMQLDKGCKDPDWLCVFANEMGCVDSMRNTALCLRMLYSDGIKRECLDKLLAGLDRFDERVHQLRLAVAMALHPRLGHWSLISCLGVDLLPGCIPNYTSPPMRMWSDVFGLVL